MKILQLITHLELGGAQKATLFLSSWLNSRGHYVILGAGEKGLLVEDAKNTLGENFKKFRFLVREINPLYDLVAFFSLLIYLLQEKFDIVHTHTSKAGVLGRWAAFFTGTKSVHTVHGFAFHDYQNTVVKWLYIIVEKLTARITSRIIAVCEQVRNKGLRYKIGRKSKYEVVYELIQIPPVKVVKDKKNSPRIVGMVSALKPQKNPWDFIKLARMLSCKYPDLEFHIVGDGKLSEELKKGVNKWGMKNKVKFWGWRKDVWRWMANFDLLVLTSLFEGLPHVVVEAMSMGIPVVAYGVDGVKDIVHDGVNGFIVTPKNLTQLGERVESLLNNSSLREKISTRCREFVGREKKLDYFYNLSRIEMIYKEVKNE